MPHFTVSPTRVLILDDHPAIRYALNETISAQRDLDVMAKAASADEAFEAVTKECPDVAVVDIALGDAHGLDLVQRLHAVYPDVKVVVFSMYDETIYAERALRAGASGYLMKSESPDQVVEAIRAVVNGEIYLSRRMSSKLLSRVASGRKSSEPSFAIDDLTDREMAVFQMMGQGHNLDEISHQLNLSRKTVETYRRRAKEKLGCDSVSVLLQYSVQWTISQGNTVQAPLP